MRLLLALSLKAKRHLFLIISAMIAMVALTIASQLEVLTIGIITQKSVSFFELFAPIKHNRLQDIAAISHEDLEARFQQLDSGSKGYITAEDTNHFLSQVKRKGLVDRIIANVDSVLPLTGNLRNLAILIAIVGAFRALSLFWHRFTVRLVSIKISRDLRQDYFEHIQQLPMSFYQKHNIGSLSARVVADANAIADGINAALVNYIQTPFTMVSTSILCFITSWKLSLLIFFGIPSIIFPIVALARKVRRVSKQLQKNQEHFASALIDFLAGIQTVKMFAMEDFSLKKYSEQNEKMAALETKSARYGVSTRPIVHSIGMFFFATALLYGLYVLNMDISDLFVYGGCMMVFYEPIKKFAEENVVIQRGAAAAERMCEVLDIQPQIEDAPNAQPLQNFEKEIAFKDVWFRYDDEWILKGVSFTVEKGSTVAIVGPTGAGKSTIVQLLPRLYDIEKGEILIDGHPLNHYTQNSLREKIAFVPQKPFLFQDTVASNIAFGRPFAKEQIKAAARQAHAEEFILQLPEQYQSTISEGGKNLSGGQQQRLAIARALVKKSPVLVMDEATSSLDAISEGLIKDAITELHGQVTQVLIAHRLATISHADKIIYLDKGEVLAEGSLETMLEICSPFRTMWDMLHKEEESTA